MSRTWWWSQIFSIFSPTWGNDSIWLGFFRWVETTNWRIIQVLCATQRMRMRWCDSSLLRSSNPSLRVRVRQEWWENGRCEDNVFGGRFKVFTHSLLESKTNRWLEIRRLCDFWSCRWGLHPNWQAQVVGGRQWNLAKVSWCCSGLVSDRPDSFCARCLSLHRHTARRRLCCVNRFWLCGCAKSILALEAGPCFL